jgi:antitoxin FitA
MEALMGNLLVRDISPALKADLSEAARRKGHSMSEEVKLRLAPSGAKSEVGRAPEQRSAWDEIRAALGDNLMTDEEHADFMRVIEETRKDFGRPPPDFE